jgi:dienelactone hydrolase
MTIPAGSHLGRYRILDLLGAGGMGMVYRARDDRLERDVAIKVLPAGTLADESARHRFRKEALALAKLSHPNIAAVYDVGDDGDVAYLVMECVPGESLAARLSRAPLSLVDALTITTQIASGLAEAHERDVIHRDLKPANVMLTPKGQAKVLDFGLAKLLAPADRSRGTLSRADGGGAGTPLYMSPEQAFGEVVDARTDIWSLGVVLFESLTGRAPFEGATDWALLNAVTHDPTPSACALRPELPAAIEPIIARALSKDPAARYQTAEAIHRDLADLLQRISSPPLPAAAQGVRVRAGIMVGAVAFLLAVIGAGAALSLRWSHRTWARDHAAAEVARLVDADLPLAASSVLSRSLSYLPRDTTLLRLSTGPRRTVVVQSSPSGARVAIQDYLTPDSGWRDLGTTPISGVVIPRGYYRWRVTPSGGSPVILAPRMRDTIRFALGSTGAPPGMVHVPAQFYGDYDAFLGWIGPYNLPPFDIGRYEVTNREYQQFVDSGGYRSPQWWREPLADDGRPLAWDSAMARFRDGTGRPGPSTWSGGHFPAGHDDDPVHGISWYEAAAYAAFRGDALPAMVQWHAAAPTDLARYIAPLSNTAGSQVAKVGAFLGIGPYGTYDMAGNVREWVYNATQTGERFILGGAWSSPGYLYAESEALPPFDRSAANGLRLVHNVTSPPAELLQSMQMIRRDFSHFTPASDAVFNAYRVMYSYDTAGLAPRSTGVVQKTPDWTLERVTFNAGYNGERMAAYLYLPTHVKPPYQAAVFFPSARVLDLQDSRELGDTAYFDYVVQSGRAVIYPVYQETYERRIRGSMPGASLNRTILIDRARDVGRALDYLQTRPDIDMHRVAYMGVSMGAAEGAIYATLEQARLRTAVFLDGGYFLGKPAPGTDQADFVPRLKIPVLMVNGRYDQTFTYDDAQLPMFRMLGTPPADKKQVLLMAAHDVTSARPTLVRAVLGWLDQYLGRVR